MQKDYIIKQPLAIVGIACRFPGADNLEMFWDLVRRGACSITQLPPDRLKRSLYYSSAKGKDSEGKTYSTLSGTVSTPQLDEKLCSDPGAYDIAHLIMLEVAASACRDAGWDPLALPLRNAGVYIGHARTSSLPAEITFSIHAEDCVGCLSQVPAFKNLPESLRHSIMNGIIRNVHHNKPHLRELGKPFWDPAMAATLVSQALGLKGPHMAIDAACASSLVAVALAAGPLQEGRIDMAIAGGASFSNWQSMALFSKAQALSASGSHPFDSRADGFISSDGYAAIILKTLNRALADGDRIHAVIRGIGMSSDGRGKSLWAPRKEGQIEAIRRAYANGVDPALIQYIEAHGTSTQLGDATELQSLAEVLSPILPLGRKIPIASVKGNIGHTCEAAGLAGLIKTVLAMHHGIIPPAAGFERPSSGINLEHLPFIIPQKSLEWPAAPDGHPRRAAVDAFGIGGLNAHLVVDEFMPSSRQSLCVPADLGVGENKEVAIIGVGAVFPGAPTATAFWEMIASGRDPKSVARAERWDPDIYWNPHEVGPWRSPSRIGGFISDFKLDPKRFRIPPKQMETADPLQYMVLDAADQALRDAGYDNKPFDRRRVAVIVGTMFWGDFMRNLTVALQYPEFERELQNLLGEQKLPEEQARDILAGARKVFHQHKPMLKDETGSFSASTLASRIARTLDFMGGALSVDAEEASSGAALDAATALLRSRACDMVLCVGAQRSMDIGIYAEYALRGLLTADGQGFVPAEGAGIVLLKRETDARRDGDHIRAIITEVRGGRGEVGSGPDPVARQMGHALGASGMASLLAAIAPEAAPSATVTTATPRGLSFGIDVEKQMADTQCRVAFLFPGQGSQYAGMLRELVRESSAAAAKLHEADALMKKLGHQSFSEIAWGSGTGLGTDPFQTQVSMLLADIIVLAALTDIGVHPDVVAGHSYGEFPALVAAGAWTLEQAIRATRVRADLVQLSAGADCMLMATNARPEAAQRIINISGLSVHIAILNAPDQTILGGSLGDLECITSRLKAESFHCSPLPLPGAFHTPLFGDVRAPFLRALSSIHVFPPQIPLLSSVSVRYVAEPAEIRENLATQPSTLLNYPEIVGRLAADGVTVFVEVGPQQVLTRLNQRLLGGRAIAIACDHNQKPGMAQLRQVKRTVESLDVDIPVGEIQRSRSDLQEMPKPEILYFDATLRRREKNLRRSDMSAPIAEQAPILEPRLDGKTDWESYLIQFVCEQTGYAREVIDFDADLESDLGVDSIKKMQLFSELRGRFNFSGLQPAALSSFSTLRHVLDFLQGSAKIKENSAISLPYSVVENNRTLKILRLQGNPYAMGREHGRRRAGEIQAIVRSYIDIMGGNVGERQDLKEAMQNLDDYFGKSSLEELRGLADGAGLPLEIIAGFNLGLMPELLPGCSHFAFWDCSNGFREVLHGTNEDAPLALMLGRELLPTAVVRHPEAGIPHLTFVLPGQFAGLNGINARGLAVSSTLLLDRMPSKDMNRGRMHCDLVKEILENAADIETAVSIVRRARRASGWGLLLSHQKTQNLRYLEYDANEVAVDSRQDYIVGANHSLLGTSRNGNRAPEHSIDRLTRLNTLVSSNGNGGCSMEAVQAALRDCHDLSQDCRATRPTMSTVRRVDNLMSLVMRPQQNEVWVAAGVGAETYQRLDLKELFNPHIMSRWVLRTVESPRSSSGQLHFRGASLVVGNNLAAKALESQLVKMGAAVVDSLGKPEDALEFLDRAWNSNPVLHLFLMSGRDEQAPDLLSIYGLCQRWVARVQRADLLSESTLVAATSLGGDFGFSGHIGIVEGGGLAGLLKAIRREFPGLKVKIIDALREESHDSLASDIIHELGTTAAEVEAGYRLGKRFTVRAIQRPALPRSQVPITQGGTWLVTGGKSGITAYSARALAEKFDLRMHVLGRSSVADLEYPATYHCCDVADVAALEATLKHIRQDSGPIRGILHGAGVESAARLERKDKESIQATVTSKAYGASYLMELTREDPLEVFLAFGSVSGRFGGQGQTDYSLASDLLAKLIQRFRLERPDCASIAFHWPAWDEIGMAMRTESRAALELAGQQFMPPKEGLEHIFAELNAGAPEGEVLILDGPGTLDLDGCMQAASSAAVRMPLVEGVLTTEPARSVAEMRFNPIVDLFLREHCYRGVPLLPAAVGLEALAEGAVLTSGEGQLALRDVDIRHGLSFPNRHPLWVRAEIARDAEGAGCRLVGEFRSRDGKLIDPNRVLISANARNDASASPCPVPDGVAGVWHPMHYPKDGPLIHGPSFRCLKELAFNKERGSGKIVAQAAETLGGVRQGAWLIPVAELDACLVACGSFALKKLGMLALPKRFDLLRFFRQPIDGELCLVQFCYRGREDVLLRFDFDLFGADGAAILHAEGFGAAIAGQGADL